MRLVEGIEHLTFLSDDLDRLAAFYERVFEASKTLDLTEQGFRHIFLQVGPTTVLHPFQILDGPALPPAPGTMFQRGRLDHFSLLAPSEQAFREIRRRLESEGATARAVRDTGTAWIMDFHDPDGLYVMVIHDCDLRDGLHAKRWFDVVGHYSREEVWAIDSTAPAAVAGERACGQPRG